MMTKKINKGHQNATNQSAASKADGIKRLTKRFGHLNKLVSERQTKFIPMGDLPSSVLAYIDDKWLPKNIDRNACKVTKNIIYAPHNINLRNDLNTLLGVINKPIKDKRKFDEHERRIAELEIQVKNLAAENLKLEHKYGKIIKELTDELAESENVRKRFKDIIENKKNVLSFPQ